MRTEWLYATLVVLIIVFMATSHASTPNHKHECSGDLAEIAPEAEPFNNGRYKVLSLPDHRQ